MCRSTLAGRHVVSIPLLALLAAGLCSPSPIPAQVSPNGPEFQVNSYTTSAQYAPAVASDAAGNFVVVWQSYNGSDDHYLSIQGQRYASSGAEIGEQFQVNSYTTSAQRFPAVASDATGNFIAVWSSVGSNGTDSSNYSIQGQRYASNGAKVGDEFQVNSYTTNYQRDPTVAADATGNFVVVWMSKGSYGTDNDLYSVQGQRYASNGTKVGDEFQVNSYTTLNQSFPAVAADANSNLIVVWQSRGSNGTDTDVDSIQGQRYASNGTPIGGEFQVNSYTTSAQYVPAVASDYNGSFVVVWESYGSVGDDNSAWSVQGQRYSADGLEVGGEFQVNSYTAFYQRGPAVASDAGGSFVVVWKSFDSVGDDNSGYSIQGQRYDSSGTKIDGEFQVNNYTTFDQFDPAVAADAAGNFVVAWRSYGSNGNDNESTSIQGQRYDALFRDGFESNDTSRWSVTSP